MFERIKPTDTTIRTVALPVCDHVTDTLQYRLFVQQNRR